MNKAQRKILQGVVDTLSGMNTDFDLAQMTREEICDKLSNAESTVSEVASEERDKFDNMNEGLQGTEKGQALSDAADTLENINWPDVDDDFKPKEGDDDTEDLANTIQTAIDDIETLL